MDQAFCNFNPDAEEDDGSCEGTPGCTDDHYVQYSADAAVNLKDRVKQLGKKHTTN